VSIAASMSLLQFYSLIPLFMPHGGMTLGAVAMVIAIIWLTVWVPCADLCAAAYGLFWPSGSSYCHCFGVLYT